MKDTRFSRRIVTSRNAGALRRLRTNSASLTDSPDFFQRKLACDADCAEIAACHLGKTPITSSEHLPMLELGRYSNRLPRRQSRRTACSPLRRRTRKPSGTKELITIVNRVPREFFCDVPRIFSISLQRNASGFGRHLDPARCRRIFGHPNCIEFAENSTSILRRTMVVTSTIACGCCVV